MLELNNQRIKSTKAMLALQLGAVAWFAAGCGSTAATNAVPNTVISGQLSGVSLMMSALEESQETGISSDFNALTITNYGVRCVTLGGTPQAGEGACDSSGNFSLALASATSVPIGCFVIQGSGASANVVAVMAFQGTTTGLDGNPQRQGSYVAGSGASGVSFGTVTVDLTKGQATVTQSNVVQTGGSGTSGASGTFTDLTGLWSIHTLPSVPQGYSAVCAAGTQNCQGPVDGQTIYFSEYNVTDNTAAVHHGLSIWQSQAALTSCSGEGITLPAGWTVAANANNPNENLMTAAVTPTAFANPTTTAIQNQGGNFCGITQDGTHTQCSDIGMTYTWGAGANSSHWGLTPIQCQFYCSMNGSWNVQTGCPTQMNVNWNGFGAALGMVTPNWNGTTWTVPAADVTPAAGSIASYLGGVIQFGKNPRNRFMSNELVITGNVGTLVSSESRTQTACTSYDANNNCVTPVTCHVNQNNRLTITQSSPTAATMELIQQTSVSNTDAAPCTTDTKSRIGIGQTNFLFRVTKP